RILLGLEFVRQLLRDDRVLGHAGSPRLPSWCSSGGRLAAMPSRQRRLATTCCEGAMDRRAAGLYAAFLACRRHRRRGAGMPETVAPGVYVEEAPPGAPVIAGGPPSVAAFGGAPASRPPAAPRLVARFARVAAQCVAPAA